MLIQDFLSEDNFHILFNYLQDYGREKRNYDFLLNSENKKIVGKFMEVIFENNYNSMTKSSANSLVIDEIKKIINKRSRNQFLKVEEMDKFSDIKELLPIKDLNKPSSLLPKRFESIFKKQAKGIESNLIIDQKDFEPQLLYKNVFKTLKFKEHDLTKAPRNENMDLLIPLPEKFKGMFDKPIYIENTLVFIDSRDRNNDLYANTNNYSLKLDRTIKNVISVELLQATLPNSEYLINDTNNTIHFQETSGTTITAQIDNGNYILETDIALKLQISMNNSGDSTYSVSYNSFTKKFTIQSDKTGGTGLFLLKFKGSNEIFGTTGATRSQYLSSSIGEVLGFSKIDLGNSSSHTSQNNPNLSSDRSIFMNINASGHHGFDNVEGIKNSDFGKFMQLSLTSDFGEYTYFINPRASSRNVSTIPENKIDKSADFKLLFNPPISIDKLNFEFKKYNEDFFNFHGMEHSLLFRFEMFNFHYENILLDYTFPEGTEPRETIDVSAKLTTILELSDEDEESSIESEYLETEFI